MATSKINGVNLYWERHGMQGPPLIFIHGSWGDHHNWDGVVEDLSKCFAVITYDRRGHSQSERPEGQGTLEEDVSDLIALAGHLKVVPAHIAGNSGGAAVALKAATRMPELFRTLVVHEPPLFGLLKDLPEAQPLLETAGSRIDAVGRLIEKNEYEQAARLFVETIAFGAGAWDTLPEKVRETFVYNAPTFLDETKDPESLEINTRAFSNFTKPVLLSGGTTSPPFFKMVLEQLNRLLPGAERKIFDGAGHVPHLSHPTDYMAAVKEFCLRNN